MCGILSTGKMSETLRNHLKQKGWNKKEIAKVMKTYRDAKKKRSLLTEEIIGGISIFTIVFGNVLAALALLPVLLTLSGTFMYLVVAVLGLIMGLLLEVITRCIDLESRHHYFISLVVPLLALGSFVFVIVYVNKVLSFIISHNPITISLVYAIAFLVPYAHHKFVLKKHYYSG